MVVSGQGEGGTIGKCQRTPGRIINDGTRTAAGAAGSTFTTDWTTQAGDWRLETGDYRQNMES